MKLTNVIVRPWGGHWVAWEWSEQQDMYVFAGFGMDRAAAVADLEGTWKL